MMTFFKGFEKDMIFYTYAKEDHIFPYIKEDIILPLFPENLAKDADEQTFSFTTKDVLEGMAYFLTVKEISEYKNMIQRILKAHPETLKLIMQERIATKDYEKLYGILVGMEQCFKDDHMEIHMEIMENKTIVARMILQSCWHKEEPSTETDAIERDYEKDLYTLYDRTQHGKYAYYIGELYEARENYLKAKLIYKKAMEKETNQEVLERIRERLEEIHTLAENEKIDYLMATGAYEDALEALEKEKTTFINTLKTAQCLWMTRGGDVAIKRLIQYEEENPLTEEEKSILMDTMDHITNHL
ncbi:MAG: hypothetical protein Q4Q17_03025 [Tissierellia bacterium]|nr:hypothetical protein [Tissierellia bacterium]